MEGPVLVTGGTGTLGRLVVARLTAHGASVRVLSRRERRAGDPAGVEWVVGDMTEPAAAAAAVAGVRAIVHCASQPRDKRADVEGTRTLLDAARAAAGDEPGALPHVVFISIVGVDRVPLAYYRRKLAVEDLIAAGGLPWTTLRATQFHDLIVLLFAALSRSPLLPVPAATSDQPVDAGEVADRLVELVAGPPAGLVPDMAGPQVRRFSDLAHAYLKARGIRRLVVPVWLPGRVARGYRSGGHLAPGHADGRRTFEEHLAERVGPGRAAAEHGGAGAVPAAPADRR
jgi:uncharacterized protein YbjT (DUF2867 family)